MVRFMKKWCNRYLKGVVVLIFIAAALSADSVHATAQLPDILIYRGETFSLFTNPLESYFNEDHPKPREILAPGCTASWRGYVATWEIKENHLYLVKLTRGCSKTEIPLEKLFPGRKGPIQALWYDGTLRVPQGKRLMYVHMGYGSVYERDIWLTIEKGRLIEETVTDNTKEKLPPAEDKAREEIGKMK